MFSVFVQYLPSMYKLLACPPVWSKPYVLLQTCDLSMQEMRVHKIKVILSWKVHSREFERSLSYVRPWSNLLSICPRITPLPVNF